MTSVTSIKHKTPLCKLAYKYGSDKCPQISHCYTPFYYQLLKKHRRTFKKVLEIGVGSKQTMYRTPDHYQVGAGLKMWRDFFPKAQIYGMDIDPGCIFQDERITTYLLDSTRNKSMRWMTARTGTDIDLVIDDGGHLKWTQIRTFNALMPLLKKDVIYIIEDSKNPSAIKAILSQNYLCEIYAPTNHRQDNLIIVRNK